MISTMLRRIVKCALANVLYYSGFVRFYVARRKRNSPQTTVVNLTYHRILDDSYRKKSDTQPGMCVTRGTFEKQMRFLSKHYDLMSFEQLGELIEKKQPIPRKAAVVVFDDGWCDNYQYAFPIMKEHHVPGTIFLATDLMETNKLPVFIEVSLLLGEADLWPHKAVKIFRKTVHDHGLLERTDGLTEERLETIGTDASVFMVTLMLLNPKYMEIISDEMKKAGGLDIEKWNNNRWMLSWDEIREMDRDGICFGSHGKSHDLLIRLSSDQIRYE